MLREPHLINICPRGDEARFLWVMEPERGRVFGKAFRITGLQAKTMTEKDMEDLRVAMYDEMIERSKDDKNIIPEGSDFDAFL
jgi:hypothetical protein